MTDWTITAGCISLNIYAKFIKLHHIHIIKLCGIEALIDMLFTSVQFAFYPMKESSKISNVQGHEVIDIKLLKKKEKRELNMH